MAMLFHTFAALLASLALTWARDNNKLMKTVPTISNSLVNLGKMEVAFYFNGKPLHNQDMTADHASHHDFYPPAPVEENCPCSNFKPLTPSFLSNPTDVINKILKSNDLFKDPSSSLCCESVEHIPDNSFVFDMNANNIPTFPLARSPMSFPTFFYDKNGANKPKTIEIFMFPRKNKDMTYEITNILKPKKRDPLFKPDIQAVGDKEFGLKQPSASVKKDLTLLEKKTKEETTETPNQELQTDAVLGSNVNNAL